MQDATRWKTIVWATLLVLPGGLWILGALAIFNALRRRRAQDSVQPLVAPWVDPANPEEPLMGCAELRQSSATSTWF